MVININVIKSDTENEDGVYVKSNGVFTKLCPVPSTGFGRIDINWINNEPTTTTVSTTYKSKEMNVNETEK